ncbi:MAG: hypothetical protein KBB32_11295 [Spirochaetia bacterium]|nr:hypothetical protein [Spirochaetia bacterium]
MRRYRVTACALLLLCGSAFALDFQSGSIRLSVDEKTGRFSVYQLAEDQRWAPLLYDQETRTSYASLSVDGKVYRLGESGDFRVSLLSKTADGCVIEHRSKELVVRQTFTLAKSGDSAYGVAIAYELENVGGTARVVGLRVLLDTWLGEKSGPHFTNKNGPVANETLLEADSGLEYVKSASGPTSLSILLSAPASVPDTTLLANWKRLNDASWSFDSYATRNFTLLPYSINDSAVALYYNPETLAPKAKRNISLFLSTADPEAAAILAGAADGATTDAAAGSATEPTTQATDTATAAPSELSSSVMTELLSARALLARINEAIAAGGTLSDEELAAIRELLARLEERAAGY